MPDPKPNPLQALWALITSTGSHANDNKAGYGVLVALALAAWPMFFPGTPSPDAAKIQQVVDDGQAVLAAAQKTLADVKAIKAEIDAAKAKQAELPPAVAAPPLPVPPAVVEPEKKTPFTFKDAP